MDGLHNQVDNPFISTAHQKFLNWCILLWEERPNIGHNYWSHYTRLKLPLKCYSDYLYWAMNTSNWREINKSLFVSFIWSYFSLCLLWFLWTSGLPRGNLFILLIETFFLPVYIYKWMLTLYTCTGLPRHWAAAMQLQAISSVPQRGSN